MKKWICKTFLLLAAVLVTGTVLKTDASAASYKLIDASSYGKSSQRTVSGRTFEVQYNNGKGSLSCTYNGRKKTLATTTNNTGIESYIITNGKTVYFATQRFTTETCYCQIAKVNSDGTGYEILKSFNAPQGFTLCGYYKDKLYFIKYKDFDYTTLQSYTIRTKKVATVLKNAGNVEQYKNYFYLVPIRGDLAPLKLRVYNINTKKMKTITKKMASYDIVGGKLYYAEYITCDSTSGKNVIRIRRSSLTGSGKKTLIKKLKARGVYKFGKKSVKYYNYDNALKTKKY